MRVLNTLIGKPWILIGAVLAVVFALWVASTRTQAHAVRAAFDAAVNVVPGLDVQVDGIDVGKVKSVDFEDGRAIVVLGIDDERFWPLRAGSTARLSWGTTAGTGTRRVDLDPAAKGPELAEGGIIETKDTTTPVEFDEIFNTLDAEARRDLTGVLKHLGGGLRGRSGDLNAALLAGAPALEETSDVLTDLSRDEAALSGLVTSTDRTTAVLAQQERAIASLISVAAATFDTLARNSDAVQRTLTDLPPTLRDARSTLVRLDPSVERLDGLVNDLRPGAQALGPLADVAVGALGQLRPTAVLGRDTVAVGTRAAPQVTRLLKKAQPFATTLGTQLEKLTPMLACIRPYAPEVGGFAHGFGSWTKNYVPNTGQEGRPNTPVQSHYARVLALESSSSLHNYPPSERTSSIATAAGKRYSFPRPPGFDAGQPQLMPECQVGAEALDPSKDPEAKLPTALTEAGAKP